MPRPSRTQATCSFRVSRSCSSCSACCHWAPKAEAPTSAPKTSEDRRPSRNNAGEKEDATNQLGASSVWACSGCWVCFFGLVFSGCLGVFSGYFCLLLRCCCFPCLEAMAVCFFGFFTLICCGPTSNPFLGALFWCLSQNWGKPYNARFLLVPLQTTPAKNINQARTTTSNSNKAREGRSVTSDNPVSPQCKQQRLPATNHYGHKLLSREVHKMEGWDQMQTP